MASSEATFAEAIDAGHDAAASIVLRYRGFARLHDDDAENGRVQKLLARTSIREGARIVPLLEYRGVRIDVLDETSLMHTHTLKAVDGCLTAAFCLARGDRAIVVESGGNTATALAAYGRHAGLEVVCFVPEANLDLLDGELFAQDGVRLVAVADAGRVKDVAAGLCRQTGLRKAPEVAWRYRASRFLGYFLAEQILAGEHFDWMAQTISAAFGPIGIYAALRGLTASASLPRFLGIQQAANCAMVRAWRGNGSGSAEGGSKNDLLAPVMYDRAPTTYGTFPELRDLLVATRGDLITIDRDEFQHHLRDERTSYDVLDALKRQGIDIAIRDGEIVERTGLIAVAGVLAEIAAGRISAGSRVLVCLTSGVKRLGQPVAPTLRITGAEPLAAGEVGSLAPDGGRP